MSNLIVPIAIWNTAPSHSVSCICLSSDEKVLVSGSRTGQLCIWKWMDEKIVPVVIVLAHDTSVCGVVFASLRGLTDAIVSVGIDGSLGLWDPSDGLCVEFQSKLLQTAPSSIAILSDKQHLACAGHQSEVEILDLYSLKVVITLRSYDDWVCSLFPFNLSSEPDVTLGLLSLTFSGTLQFWTVKPDEATTKPLFTNQEEVRCTSSVCLSPNRTIFMIINSQKWKLHSVVNCRELVQVSCPKENTWAGGSFVNDEHVIVWTENGIAYLYRIPQISGLTPLSTLDKLNSRPNIPTKEPEPSTLTVQLIQVYTTKNLNQLESPRVMGYSRQTLFVGDDNGNISLWKVTIPGASVSEFPLHEACPSTESRLAAAWEGVQDSRKVTAMVVLEESLQLICGYEDGFLSISQLPTEKSPKFFKGHTCKVMCLLSPPSNIRRFFISGAEDGTIKIWDLTTTTLLQTFSHHTGAVTHLFQLPLTSSKQDEEMNERGSFFSVSKDRTVGLFSLQNMNCKRIFGGHPAPIVSVRLRLDQDYLLVECADGSVTIWEITTGQTEGCVYGQLAVDIKDTCEDLSRDSKPKMLQIQGLSAVTVQIEESHPIQLILLNVKRMLQELYQVFKGLKDGQSAPHYPVSYKLFSYLLPWDSNIELNEQCQRDLNLSPPNPRVLFGLRGSDGKIALMVPSSNTLDRWNTSVNMTAIYCLSSVTITKALLYLTETKNACSQLLSYFCAILPEACQTYVDPSLVALARYWQDPVDDIMYSARSIFIATLDRKSLDYLKDYTNNLVNQLKTESSQGNITKSLRIIVLGIIGSERPTSLDNSMLSQVTNGLVKLLFQDAAISIQGAAVELLGKGFPIWRTYIKDQAAIIHKLFSMTLVSKPLKKTAHTALLNIGAAEPCQFVSSLTEEVFRKQFGPQQHSAALMIIASLVKRNPIALLPQLPRLVESVIKCLDPTDPVLRDSLLKSTTVVLHAIVTKYPMISFHQESQRLAVGTNKNVIIIYDLKSATRIHILEGHTGPITAVSFSNDGKMLASYSLEESLVRFWQTASSFFGLSSQPRFFACFPVTNTKRSWTPLYLLESVQIEWASPRTLLLKRGWEASLTLQV